MRLPRSIQTCVPIALTAMALGCAHCDTCDDMPTPCMAGGGCGVHGAPVAMMPTSAGYPIAAPAPMAAPGTGMAGSFMLEPAPTAAPFAGTVTTGPATAVGPPPAVPAPDDANNAPQPAGDPKPALENIAPPQLPDLVEPPVSPPPVEPLG